MQEKITELTRHYSVNNFRYSEFILIIKLYYGIKRLTETFTTRNISKDCNVSSNIYFLFVVPYMQ